MNNAERHIIPLSEVVDMEAFDALPKIGFAGPPSSGKGTAAEFLSSNYGFAKATFSQGIRNHAQFMHGIEPPYPRELLKETGLRMIDAFGPLALLRNAVKRTMYDFAQNPSLQGIVLDGFRWPQEGYAISQLPNSLIIWIEANQETRKQRLFERGRPGDMTEADFYETDKMEIDWVEPIRRFSLATIVNDGDIESFQAQITELMEERFNLKKNI